MNSESVAEFLKPRLRLFLSVDLVGSTALKHKEELKISELGRKDSLREMRPEWFSVISNFYHEINALFAKKWKEYKSNTSCVTGPDPEIWKVRGDEVLFSKEITEPFQVYGCVGVWMDSVREYRLNLKDKNKILDVKCTAWTAGFPLSNTEILISSKFSDDDAGVSSELENYCLLEDWYEKGKKNGVIRDYIGPAIDTGFRLATLASPRKFIVSVEVAMLLDKCQHDCTSTLPEIHLFYEGRSTLKGILDGKPYPFVWVDMLPDDKVLKLEDRIKGAKKVKKGMMYEFCSEFIEENKHVLMRPFIVNSCDDSFNKPPDGYDNYIAKLNDAFRDEKERMHIRDMSLLGENEPESSVEIKSIDTASLEESVKKIVKLMNNIRSKNK